MKRHILLVDDDEMIGEALRDYLEFMGYVVLYVTSGDEALELANVRHKTGMPFDVGISDVRMPDMDGVTLSRELYCRYKLPMLLVSGHQLEPAAMQTSGTGIRGVFRKPYPLTVLTSKLEEVLTAPLAV